MPPNNPPPHLPYYIGTPLWALPAWKGNLFTPKAKPAEFLSQYAHVFNAVEGNTTFYSVPSESMVTRWLAATPDTFRFSFKFPRTITHQLKLQNAAVETSAFLQRMAPLGERLRPFMIQLPASFSPAMLGTLERFLRALPRDFQYAVEVRHPAFFTDHNSRAHYNGLLQGMGIDRVIFESRPVHSAPALDQPTQEAQARKPRLPVQLDTTARSPILRYIGHPVVEENQRWLEPWVAQTARWIEAGLTPYIFLHTPSNIQAPLLVRAFHQSLQTRLAGQLPKPTKLPDLPNYPGEQASSGGNRPLL